MNEPCGIIEFGANGSGKTTLGRELARVLGYRHMDIENYSFEESDIPYSKMRKHEDVAKLMLDEIEKYRTFIISAVTGDLGDSITRFYKLGVCMSAPLELRVNRIKQRAFDHYGDRVLESGDMYEQEIQFYDFVASRSLEKIEQWSKTLSCPIIRVDGTQDLKTNVVNIVEFYSNL